MKRFATRCAKKESRLAKAFFSFEARNHPCEWLKPNIEKGGMILRYRILGVQRTRSCGERLTFGGFSAEERRPPTNQFGPKTPPLSEHTVWKPPDIVTSAHPSVYFITWSLHGIAYRVVYGT